MTMKVISKSASGSVVAHEESLKERADRIKQAAERAASQVQVTPGQSKVLSRIRRESRLQRD